MTVTSAIPAAWPPLGLREQPPDIAALLDPIAADRPTGESLRYDPQLDAIKRMREQDDASLPMGVWQRELKRADWPGVAAACTQALTERSKDLHLAAWLTEAWIHLYGFRGLAAGLRLEAALCRDFWAALYPPLDDDGSSDARLAPVVWTIEKLPNAVRDIAITAPSSEDVEAYGWNRWETAQHLTRLARGDAAAAAAAAEKRGDVTQAKFLVSVSLTPAHWMAALAAEVADAIAAAGELEASLSAQCGEREAPSVTPLRSVLEAIQVFTGRVVQERVEKGELMLTPGPAPQPEREPSIAVESAGAETSMLPVRSESPARTGAISSRAEAYQALREASDYLLRTEPHSPVPYLVRRAVSWGNLSLAELLEELLQKNSDISTVYALLGMNKPK